MTDSETTRDPFDDYIADDVSVISDTTHGTDDVTSPSAWAGLKGLLKSPSRKRECLHSPSNKGDCSPIIPSQNRTLNLNGDAEPDDCMSDVESVMSTSLLSVKGMLSRQRDTNPSTHSEDDKHRVNSLVMLTSDKSNLAFSKDETENIAFTDKQFHSFSVPTKSPEHSKQEQRNDRKHHIKAPKADYAQILDEIFGSKATMAQCGPQIPPEEDFQQKGHSVPTQHSSNKSLQISVSEKMDSASASSSQLSDLLLNEKCVKPSPRHADGDDDDQDSNHSDIIRETKRGMAASHKVITPSTEEVIPLINLTQKTCCKSQGHQHGIDKTEVDENWQSEILTDTAGCKHPPLIHQIPVSQMTLKDMPVHDELLLLPTRENLYTNEQSVSQMTQEEVSFQQPPKSKMNELDLSTHLEPMSKMIMEDFHAYQHPISQLPNVILSTHQQPVSQLTEEDLSTQLLDFIVEFTQVSSTASGMGPSGSGPERLLESLPEHQDISSPYEPLLKNESSEKLLLPNQETSSKSVRVANGPNNVPEIGKHSEDKQLFARSKNGKQKSTKIQKDVVRVPLTSHPGCDPAKMESGPWASSVSTQGLQANKSDQSQFSTNESRDLHNKQSTSGTEEDRRLTGLANEKKTLVNLMERYESMDRALQGRPDKSRVLEIATELKQIQGAVCQLNEKHKTERGSLSVRVGVKGLSKSSKKQLKKELQELGDRQKHLLQVVHRHKQINFSRKQVLAGMGTFETFSSGRESSKDTHGDVKTFPPSRLVSEAPTVQGDVADGNDKGPLIEEPSSVPRIYKTDIVNRYHGITPAENASASFASSFQKDNSPKLFKQDQNGVSRTYDDMKAKTSNLTNYNRKKECLVNDMDVTNQYYKDGMEQIDISDNILISKSNPTCVEHSSVITATNNELLAEADVSHAPCSQIKETEACVRSVHSSGAVDRTASQMSGIEDSQQDLFSQDSSEQEVDRRMVEEIIATQTLNHEDVMDRGDDRRMDSKVEGLGDRGVDRRRGSGIVIHSGDNTAGQGAVSIKMQKDDKWYKKQGADEMNCSTSSAPVKQLKKKADDSSAPSSEGQSDCESKKIKICTAEQFVKSVEGGQAPCMPDISQSKTDAANTKVMERDTTHQKALSSGNRNLEGECSPSQIASDKRKGFVLSVKQTCSKRVDGSFIPISLKSKDGILNKPHAIIPESRNGNNVNTTEQLHGQSLNNHANSDTLSSAVLAEGSTNILVSSSNVRSVCSNQKEVTGLSPPEQGTEKVKDVSLMSPTHPHPHTLKNITTPQKLQSENLPASKFLSPGSTVASSDVFPVSCRELVRRITERDAREKQSRKDILLQTEAPSDYIAIPVGRIEDFHENIQVKGVDNVNTQTQMFTQPQVPTAPKSVATSKITDLTTLVEKGVLTPGKDVLTVRAKGRVFQASLSGEGHIIGTGGQIFHTPKSWCQALSGAVTVKKLQSYNMVLYKGQPLSSFVDRESTESSGQKDLRAQTTSQGKLVGSTISRSLKTANKSTNLPRQSSGISSTTTAANKVRTKSLTHSFIKSLSNGTGAAPMKTSSTYTTDRQTGSPFPAPPNRNSIANRDLDAKDNKETSSGSGPSEFMRVLSKCTIKLIDDAEIFHCPEIDSTFWMTDFKDIRLSDSLWDSVDCWN